MKSLTTRLVLILALMLSFQNSFAGEGDNEAPSDKPLGKKGALTVLVDIKANEVTRELGMIVLQNGKIISDVDKAEEIVGNVDQLTKQEFCVITIDKKVDETTTKLVVKDQILDLEYDKGGSQFSLGHNYDIKDHVVVKKLKCIASEVGAKKIVNRDFLVKHLGDSFTVLDKNPLKKSKEESEE